MNKVKLAKSFMSLILVMGFLVSILPSASAAASNTSENGAFEWVIEPKYDYLGPIGYQYHHGSGLIWPFGEDGKYGYMNFDGVAREPLYDWAAPYQYGYARVLVGEQYGFILGDTPGFLFKPQFKQAGDFEFDEFGSGSAWVAITISGIRATTLRN